MTVKVATPLAFVVADTAVMVEWAPVSWVMVTAWPAIGPAVVPWSRKVTVRVEVVAPSAATAVGDATILEAVGEMTGAWKVTAAVWVMAVDPMVA